ncbi:MAG: outer membrane protein assembly factor BamA [Bacteroidota bacterium]
MKQLLAFTLLLFLGPNAIAQIADSIPVINYSDPKGYELGGVTIKGAHFSDVPTLISMSELRVGDRIKVPGPKINKTLKKFWKLGLFSDVQIYKENTIGDVVFLEIVVKEVPRLMSHGFRGVKKSTHEDLNEKINRILIKGGILTSDKKKNAVHAINQYFTQKGYFDVQTTTIEELDTSRFNAVRLIFKINRGRKVKVKDIAFNGTANVKDSRLRKAMKNTKRKSKFLSGSKFIPADYEEDKKSIVNYYNSLGYRDMKILRDSIWRDKKGLLHIEMDVEEHRKFYFGDIAWKGNAKFSDEQLALVLGIKKGDIFNADLLTKQLQFSEQGLDVSSAYMDDGYLFFQVDPVETAIRGDTVDLEMRIFEGPQATIDKVVIKGNDRTYDYVIRRELYTKPGNKFSRSDIIRSQREIINLGYFNPETLGINTPVNPERGTVDIEYQVEEKPADQLELSAGWGGNGIVGTLGVSFNNFSLQDLLHGERWNPLPQGSGQRLSIRMQSNGRAYQSVNASFTEPWFGGKKPTSLSVAGFLNRFTNGLRSQDFRFGFFTIVGGTLSIGTRLRFPDNYFVSTTALNIQRLNLSNWSSGLFSTDAGEQVTEGDYNNFSITQTIARNSVDNPLFPTKGSKISLSAQITPPYSLFNNRDYSDLEVEERFQWVEYHKWRFTAETYMAVWKKLTLKIGAKFGYIGYYNEAIGTSPFERFQLGGDGLNNQAVGFQGTDIISLRGYEVSDLQSNFIDGRLVATPLFQKVTTELRYPLSNNPSSTIYVHVFAEGGNSWRQFEEYNPFELNRSFGGGVRLFLPMFGILGFDVGFGLDREGVNRLGQMSNFNIVLGFEPE